MITRLALELGAGEALRRLAQPLARSPNLGFRSRLGPFPGWTALGISNARHKQGHPDLAVQWQKGSGGPHCDGSND
jgi:hypothetical protein